MGRVYVALDLETTGLTPDRDAIIEIGAVKFRDGDELASWSTFVNPNRELPAKIQHITGIKPEELRGAPSLFSVARPLVDFVGDAPVIGHNIGFDMRFLNKHGLLVDHPTLDTFELASILMPEAPHYNLSALAEQVEVEQDRRHRALDDAQATRGLFRALMERAEKLDLRTIQELNRLAAGTDWSLREFFVEVERNKARTAFVQPAGQAERRREGARRKQEEEALQPTAEVQLIDGESLSAMLSPGGLFEQQFPGYEYRPQQIEMLQSVADSFNEGEHLLVEAGTGTGKSVAYLLPSIYFAVANNEHVVISTNTINLQDQLFTKDIPDLRAMLPIPFNAALLKGRSNYLCLRRLAAFRRSAKLSTDEVRVLAKILAWLPQTTTGDRGEMVLLNSEYPVWAQVQAEAETCLAEQCPYRVQGECFLYRARHKAEAAHLIVVNHALLLSDIVTENRVLPEFNYLIIDEAHHLEEQATTHLGFSVGQAQLYRLLTDLSFSQGAQGFGGFLADVLGQLHESGVPADVRAQLADQVQWMHGQVESARRALHLLFADLAIFLDNFRQQGPEGFGNYDVHIRLTASLRSQPDWSGIEMRWDDFANPLRKIGKGLEQLHESLQNLESAHIEGYDELLQDVLGYRTRVQELDRQIESILANPTLDSIYWARIIAEQGSIELNRAPLHVAPLLEDRLFSRKATVILTSATLCSEGDFSYIRERLGLPDASELQVGSPFDFVSSTLLYLPTDMPEPGERNYQRAVESSLVDLCRATQGRVLVLFTSYSQLLNSYRAINPFLEDEGIVVYAQGVDGSRRQLLENFKTTPRAVLLGTRSFWEGVDVVGEALSCLVIARLPFSVPSDPVFAARSETFDDPFGQFSVPDAILRFRQGFGRLIRSASDRGVVVILDKRLTSKSYGKRFLRSLPECTVRQDTLRNLPRLAARWIDGKKEPEQVEIGAKRRDRL